jgi:hypothetical protein
MRRLTFHNVSRTLGDRLAGPLQPPLCPRCEMMNSAGPPLQLVDRAQQAVEANISAQITRAVAQWASFYSMFPRF